MRTVPLSQRPNQKIEFVVEGHEWSVRLQRFDGREYVDASVDGEEMMNGMPLTDGVWVIPYRHKVVVADCGNLRFNLKYGKEISDYTNFDESIILNWYSTAEYLAEEG